jgi:hypothetical protein
MVHVVNARLEASQLTPCTSHAVAALNPASALPQVSCLALSPSGRYLASGQVTFMGFVADVIVWDLPERRLLHRMSLHKVRAALDATLHASDRCSACRESLCWLLHDTALCAALHDALVLSSRCLGCRTDLHVLGGSHMHLTLMSGITAKTAARAAQQLGY